MFGNILIALDGSRFAERALEPALQAARKFGSRVTLVRIVTQELQPVAIPPAVGLPTVDLSDQTAELEMQEAEGYLDSLRRKWSGPGLSVSVEVARGDPAMMILDTAGAVAADLIVMTTHGRTGLRRLIYGSVAEAVLRGSDIPVLLIPIRN
jgi:nucleotide-binding universal stress UspA family protein